MRHLRLVKPPAPAAPPAATPVSAGRRAAPAGPRRRRPQIFSLLLSAFALVIVLGVGGMAGFYTLANAGHGAAESPTVLDMPDRSTDGQIQKQDLVLESALRSYYMMHNSWEGIGTHLEQLDSEDLGGPRYTYTLTDLQDQVIASTGGDVIVGSTRPPALTGPRIPIEVNAQPVGILYRNTAITMPRIVSASASRSDRLRGIVSAGLALAAILLGLATFFASRLSRPLHRLTAAAGALAAGDMSVRVPGAAVREIDDLGQAFNAMADSLARADQQRRQLTADVAHELRTPLSIIRGRLEGIQDGVYDASAQQIAGLLDETALLERLIEDLRLLALADAGQLPLYPESLDAAQLLHDVARSFSPQAAAAGVALRVEAAANLPEMQADPQRIAQVLGNLVGNALRHTPAGGMITLRAWAEIGAGRPPRLLIAVQDTGSGIAPEHLAHIFDRFWRGDRARSRSSGGAGLGLAIARRIVEAHGGGIWVQSRPGHGTSFAFSVPLPPPAHAAATRRLA